MRQERVLNVLGGTVTTDTGIKRAIGNAPHRVGDLVWVDGDCVFGHERRVIPPPPPVFGGGGEYAVVFCTDFSQVDFQYSKVCCVVDLARGEIAAQKSAPGGLRKYYAINGDATKLAEFDVDDEQDVKLNITGAETYSFSFNSRPNCATLDMYFDDSDRLIWSAVDGEGSGFTYESKALLPSPPPTALTPDLFVLDFFNGVRDIYIESGGTANDFDANYNDDAWFFDKFNRRKTTPETSSVGSIGIKHFVNGTQTRFDTKSELGNTHASAVAEAKSYRLHDNLWYYQVSTSMRLFGVKDNRFDISAQIYCFCKNRFTTRNYSLGEIVSDSLLTQKWVLEDIWAGRCTAEYFYSLHPKSVRRCSGTAVISNTSTRTPKSGTVTVSLEHGFTLTATRDAQTRTTNYTLGSITFKVADRPYIYDTRGVIASICVSDDENTGVLMIDDRFFYVDFLSSTVRLLRPFGGASAPRVYKVSADLGDIESLIESEWEV